VSALDLSSYFARIGWNGGTAPTHETLAGVLSAHMAAIPFENLDVLLGRGIRLDLPSLARKLVDARRGGYCFEHGTLLAAALEAVGFDVTRHTARVTLAAPRTESPRTHMGLTVRLPEGTFVLDPGFGALAPRVPVPLLEGTEARVGAETHWMSRDDGLWLLRTRRDDRTTDCWASALERDNIVDFEMGNHFTATWPSSPFRNRLMLRALTRDGRVSVMNRDVTIWRGANVETLVLADRAALRRVVAEHFGFDLPEIDTLRVPSIPEWG
jgi:N-hydroxyarylamine O-acetyltransferase